VVTTHNLSLAARAHRVLTIEDGKIVREESKDKDRAR
jgi:ABC-type lipoprotein export system ATPase subunit